MQVLVVGLARTGDAVARTFAGEGDAVTVIEERPRPGRYAQRRDALRAIGVTVVEGPGEETVARLVAAAGLVVPSPAVLPSHPVLERAAAAGVPVMSEIEVAAARIPAPIVAVTGTNGKTTVTKLAVAMMRASGLRACAAGNIGRPLLDVAGEAREVDAVVAEVSSFQLEFTTRFRPRVAVLLNVAPDHLDWHGSFAAYAAAKGKVFANQVGDDVLVYDADDATASALAAGAPARRLPYRVHAAGEGDGYRLDGDRLIGPGGETLASTHDLPRAMPHDLANALAAAAATRELGATATGVRAALRRAATLPHRVELVGDAFGVRWYDDSKATNPHAALHAVGAFDSVVLLAGGRNKGLDLGVLAGAAARIRAVVAFGEAAAEVAAAFDGVRPVTRAATVPAAVRAAARLAQPGDAVLLSPGCASFDAYSGYEERGADFAAAVRALLAERVGDRG